MWKLDMHHDFNRCDSSETGSSPKTSPVTNQQRNRQTIWKITPMFHNAATGQLVQMWERGPWKPELGCERWGEVKKQKTKICYTFWGCCRNMWGIFFGKVWPFSREGTFTTSPPTALKSDSVLSYCSFHGEHSCARWKTRLKTYTTGKEEHF